MAKKNTVISPVSKEVLKQFGELGKKSAAVKKVKIKK
ncbi:Uncharacterised protein [Mycobacteroides abscessus subsp. abscessus]|jgi:hypothetical protein|nr:Uncharacterised protein [Mycobacteroides abscessus subsp. abscessus]